MLECKIAVWPLIKLIKEAVEKIKLKSKHKEYQDRIKKLQDQ